ncbi:FAD:protein FMN transferase [Bacillus sp. FJAT-49732]|uniref:FAD:protein FMN transferase n=1 Tax=Lederbergia citrisecunda TaxID=2833583 RepID=A0A942TNF6_9BACI|nr:FAD:protein FMN transferase [Lederbergia citrisecunda]MBS4199389.1 FAD:protein FMN transferase [Lederbergia citrisecunda]
MLNKKWIFFIVISVILLSGCGQSHQPKVLSSPYKETEFLMGTVVTIRIYDEGKEEVLEHAFKRIKSLADQITVNEQGSEIDNINKNAGIQAVKVSEDINKLIAAGKEYSEKADGTFDISIGPLTSLWHIGFPDARKPNDTEIESVLPLISFNDIELNTDEKTVLLKKKGMQLDLGAIAKGFITDEVAKVLIQHDVETAIIDLGGNIYVMGKNPSGIEWTVGIQDPFSPRGEIVGKINESNKSIVTSGIYERFLEVDGMKYHHLLNPKDGYPFQNDVAGVSIITDLSIDGDALSTIVFSKGIKEGMKFIEGIKGAEAIFISTEKKIFTTTGLKNNFELTNDAFKMGELH